MVYETIALPLSYAGGTIGIISCEKPRSTGGMMDGLSIAASLAEVTPRLLEGRIRTIYQPARTQFVFRVYAGEDLRLLVDLREATVRLLSRATENPPSPSAFVMLLRKYLKEGRIVSVRQFGWDRTVALGIERRMGSELLSYEVIAELVGPRGNLILLQDGLVVKSLRSDRRNQVGRPYVALPPQGKVDPPDVTPEQLDSWLTDATPEAVLRKHVEGVGRWTAEDLASDVRDEDATIALSLKLRELVRLTAQPSAHVTADGERATFYPLLPPAVSMTSYQDALDHVEAQEQDDGTLHGDPLLDDLRRAVRMKKRTLDKLHSWLENAAQADHWQAQADLLMTYQSEIPRGRDSACLRDPALERDVTIPLDPSLSAIENAQALYSRAKRMRRGHPHVHDRLKRTSSELKILERALVRRERGDAVDTSVLDLLPRRAKRQSAPKKTQPFRQFDVEGFQIWMGRSARQNDALLRAASPNDFWLHVKDYAGSHVVVRSRGQQDVPTQVLQAAARLAARYSKARGERRASVIVTRVKHVRKPKGAPSGLVNVREADTLTVQLEGEES